ncbi:MAG: SDR family NAD(P)-dependent oxidoreductase [candidate division WOR-3 bacterium]|nr:MAG: SDR family NAD(P)-dependent oxidoreductase [candidate division WOR-3 bacterium]
MRKTCLVTGATSGIGLPTARALAQAGCRVVIASRNPGKCERVSAELREQTGNRDVGFIAADLSLMAAVRQAAAEFRRRYDRLDVLVNNAGISPARRRETAEGYEQTFAPNHLGHFLLTNLLLDLLLASAPARIINVTSGIYKQGRLDFDDLRLERGCSAMRAYANSKLANLLFTVEPARRLESEDVAVDAMAQGLPGPASARMKAGFLPGVGGWPAFSVVGHGVGR